MDINKVESGIFYKFHNINFMKEALTHRSYCNEDGSCEKNYERLEFLGDAVLELIITDTLINLFPDKNEGELSKTRALLVREETLVNIANKIDLGKSIILGKGEEKSGGKERPSILSGALEALVGAVYMDGGYAAAGDVVKKLWEPAIHSIHNADFDIDYKTKLQELVQFKYKTVPTYTVLGTKGPAHKRTFSVQVDVHGTSSVGHGKNKKEAEQTAAKKALSVLA